MLNHFVLSRLDRLITKYSTNVEPTFWYSKQTSRDLVELLAEHRALIQNELEEVESQQGSRRLQESDFLGPETRREMRRSRNLQLLADILREKGEEAYNRALSELEEEENKDYSQFFAELDNELLNHRTEMHKKAVIDAAEKRKKIF